MSGRCEAHDNWHAHCQRCCSEENDTLRAQLAETERQLTASRAAESLVSTRLAAAEWEADEGERVIAERKAWTKMKAERDEARAACAARDEALRAISKCRTVHQGHRYPPNATCLDVQSDARANPTLYGARYCAELLEGLHLCERCRCAALLAAPSPGAEILAQHAAERHALAMAASAEVLNRIAKRMASLGVEWECNVDLAALVKEVEATRS